MTVSTREPERTELLTAEQVAQVLGWKVRYVADRLDQEELIPAAIDPFMKGKRWRRRELDDWLAAGCPPRSLWRWEPVVAEDLAQRIRRLHRELADLEARVACRRAELAEMNA